MQTRNYAQETPDMVLYRQNKKTSLGYVKNIHNWTADYNFGAASEMSFEVPKKFMTLVPTVGWTIPIMII